MPTFKVDFSGVSTGFDPIPAGKYPAKVTDWEEKAAGPEAKNPGAPYINWEFTIQDPSEQAGRKQWLNTSLLPQALFAIKGLYKATGNFDDDDLESEAFEIDPDEIIGADVCIVVRQKTYQNELRNEVKGVKHIDEYSGDEGDDSILP